MKYIAYYRVSTTKQGDSGLGLEAQRVAVMSHLGQQPFLEFIEIESGSKSNRPQLELALTACHIHDATLVIAKLDRLARSVRFIAELMDSDVEFVACDYPQANRFMLHIMAAVAEHEREMISERTKAALAAAKARGVELGKHGRRLQTAAIEFADNLRDVFAEFEGQSYREIALALNDFGIPTFSGNPWNATSVLRTIRRLEK
jgi:DNA invertase Pin-like site-specific DNA recombinase